jgi:hypothetical protein
VFGKAPKRYDDLLKADLQKLTHQAVEWLEGWPPLDRLAASAILYRYCAAAVWFYADLRIGELRPSRPPAQEVMQKFRKAYFDDLALALEVSGDNDAAELWGALFDDIDDFGAIWLEECNRPGQGHLAGMRTYARWLDGRVTSTDLKAGLSDIKIKMFASLMLGEADKLVRGTLAGWK